MFCRHVAAVLAFVLCLAPAVKSRAAGSEPLGPEFRVNTLSELIQQSSSVAMDARGNFVVAWQSEVAGSGDDIRAQRFDAKAGAQGAEIAVNTRTKGPQNAPALAMDARGNFVVAWQSLVANNYEIHARCFDARGAARGEEFTVNTPTGTSHSAPAIAMDAQGNFVIAWESALNGSYEIRARRFSAAGAVLGGELAVNAVTASSQRAPAVAMNGRGEFVIAWRSNVEGRFEIRARRFSVAAGEHNPDGVAPAGEIAVSQGISGDHFAPAVALDAAGRFVVVWESAVGRSFEVHLRRFDARDAAQSMEQAAHAESAGNQFAPDVAVDARGNFVVAWHSKVEASHEIRALAFAASGEARGDLISVNGVTEGTQKSAAVAVGTGGEFVVTWHSDAGASWDVLARKFRAAFRAADAQNAIAAP